MRAATGAIPFASHTASGFFEKLSLGFGATGKPVHFGEPE